MEAQQFRVGDMKIVKVPELELHDFAATQLLPDIDLSALKPEQLDPRTYNIKTDRVLLSVHTWMVTGTERSFSSIRGQAMASPGQP
jgi:hypothetical protein